MTQPQIKNKNFLRFVFNRMVVTGLLLLFVAPGLFLGML